MSAKETAQAEVQSPCIGVCSMNDSTGYCYGCYRTIEEIQNWWDFDNTQKQLVLDKISLREAAVF
jgi:uncharacterized protein